MSILYSPWTSQPQQFVPRSGTDLMRGAYVWTPHNPRQLVGPRIVQATGETAYNSSPVGDKGVARKWSRSANAGVDFGTTQVITQNSGVTVLVVANPTFAATMKVPFSQRLASGAFTQTDFVFNSNGLDSLGATAGSVTLTTYHAASGGVRATSQIDGQTHCWVAGNGTANGYIFRDGVKQTLANSTRMSTFTASTQKLRVGNMGDDASTTYPCDDPVYLVVVWDRLLSEAEARSVSENPWQVFQPLPRRIFASVSAGGGVTINAGTGNADAAGLTASVSQAASIAAGVGNAAATGLTASIAQQYTLSAGVGNASSAGLTSTITASGLTTISCTTGNAAAAGATATVNSSATITCSAGNAAAAGLTAALDIAFTILANVGNATGAGLSATIQAATGISCGVANAIASGLTASITNNAPLTDSEKLDLILDILSNRQTLNPATGVYTLYADDGLTVLKTAQAWEDAAGTIPYRGRALQRLDSMG